MELSNDSKKLFFILYKEYVKRRKNGSTKSEAMSFGNAHQIHDTFLKDEEIEDVCSYIYELSKAGFMLYSPYDNIPHRCSLTNSAIVTLEKYPADIFKTIFDFLKGFV